MQLTSAAIEQLSQVTVDSASAADAQAVRQKNCHDGRIIDTFSEVEDINASLNNVQRITYKGHNTPEKGEEEVPHSRVLSIGRCVFICFCSYTSNHWIWSIIHNEHCLGTCILAGTSWMRLLALASIAENVSKSQTRYLSQEREQPKQLKLIVSNMWITDRLLILCLTRRWTCQPATLSAGYRQAVSVTINPCCL